MSNANHCPQPKRDFCPRSLGDWLELAKGIVPTVPATKIADLDLSYLDLADELLALIRDEPESCETVGDCGYPMPVMARWDCCAGWPLYSEMHDGQRQWCASSALCLPADEFELRERLKYWPRDTMPVWLRPWCACVYHDGYPVVFRAFVSDGRLEGVTSRYPERELPESPYAAWAIHAGRQALLFDSVGTYSLDFMLQRYPLDPGRRRDPTEPMFRLTLLDGGPGHRAGDAIACFAPSDVHGIALADRGLVVS